MPIAKREIVEALLARADHQRAIRADEELPELVNPALHRWLLEDLGIDITLLLRDVQSPARRFTRTRTHSLGRTVPRLRA